MNAGDNRSAGGGTAGSEGMFLASPPAQPPAGAGPMPVAVGTPVAIHPASGGKTSPLTRAGDRRDVFGVR